MAKLRILHVITGMGFGGAEVALLDLLKATQGSAEHMVLSLAADGPMRARFEAAGIPVRSARMREFLPFGASGQGLRAALAEHRPDLIHAHLHRSTFGTAIGRMLGPVNVPFVMSIHQVPNFEWAHAYTTTFLLMNNLAVRLARKAIFVSERGRQGHVRLGYPDAKTIWAPNGYDMARLRFDPAARDRLRAEWGYAAGEVVVGHVARVTPEKDHPCLFAAFERVAAAQPSARLVLAGAGTQELAIPPPIAGKVLALGMRSDAPHVMSACDIGVLSSGFSEAFPNVLAEFMAIERPCVTTDLGDSALIVGAHGRVVPPRDPAALADALCTLIAMPEVERRALGAQARQYIDSNFSARLAAERHVQIWTEAAS